MAIASQIFGFSSLTLAATVESVVAIKLFPDYYSGTNHLLPVALIFLANYAFGLVFWGLLYPVLFSPFRRLQGPRVSNALGFGFQCVPASRNKEQDLF